MFSLKETEIEKLDSINSTLKMNIETKEKRENIRKNYFIGDWQRTNSLESRTLLQCLGITHTTHIMIFIRHSVDKQFWRLNCGTGLFPYRLKCRTYRINFKEYRWQKKPSNLYLINILPGG